MILCGAPVTCRVNGVNASDDELLAEVNVLQVVLQRIVVLPKIPCPASGRKRRGRVASADVKPRRGAAGSERI